MIRLRKILSIFLLAVLSLLVIYKYPIHDVSMIVRDVRISKNTIEPNKINVIFTKYNLKTQDNYDIKWIDQEEGSEFADYGDDTCGENKHRKHLVEIFKKWQHIARSADIPYSIFAGTLLGAWRNGDIVPYDTDMDILIDRREIEKLEKIKDKRNFVQSDNKFHLILQDDWKLRSEHRRRFKCNGDKVATMSDACSFQDPVGRLIKGYHYADLYDYEIKGDMINEESGWNKTYPLSDMLPLRYCKFVGQITFCPNKPIAQLHRFYRENLKPTKICKNGKRIYRDLQKKLS